MEAFRNEPFLDFSLLSVQESQLSAIAKVEALLGGEHPMWIGSERVTTPNKFRSLDPSNPNRIIGVFQQASRREAGQAISCAERAFSSWRFESTQKRADILLRAAALMREQRYELNALLMFEVGKTWVEADGDTAEAIDFCEFYAREALRLAGPQPLTPHATERGQLKYIPLGVGAIIPPWNFPLAILVGMTTAALVVGNTVVVKPSSDAPLIATRVYEILTAAGVPPGCLNLVTGPGSEVGDALVTHPRTRFIAFTGSREVGVRIHELAGRLVSDQRWLKRSILEMGGKDFTIVDAEADLDAAVTGVVSGAFGYQGQKCSACSRAIVDAQVYEAFLARLVPAVEQLVVGPAQDPKNTMGPVINQAAVKKIEAAIEASKREGRLLSGGKRLSAAGYFLAPTVFADVAPTASIAREEIFGPVLAVLKADNFDHAIELANGTEYGLTGSFYTRNRDKIERGMRLLHCGNLYVNRKCTGALVGVHPFGGFNMSGTDSKAGGRDYLLLFTQAKVISERISL